MAHLIGNIFGVSGPPPILLTVSGSEIDYNIYSEAGSPAGIVNVILTVTSDGVISSGADIDAALNTGSGWAAGSTIKIINEGRIQGKGGNGGGGVTTWHGTAGGAGGDAISLSYNVTIDNTAIGEIFGGGGGGGGGGAGKTSSGKTCNWSGTSGDGGGGRGNNGGTAGATGVGGTNGSESAAGAGGTGSYPGGNGGAGGNAGAAGSSGANGYANCPTAGNGGAGGAAGKAIDLNGNTVTWIAGNNSTQVKGAQS